MKALLALATLTLITITSNAMIINRPGYVQEGQCGYNTMVPSPGQLPGRRPMMDYVGKVCTVTVQGMNSNNQLYSFEVFSSRGDRTVYIYSQVALKPVYTQQPVRPGLSVTTSQGRFALAQLQVIGTSNNNQFNTIYFVRTPDVVSMMLSIDRSNTLLGLNGNLQVLGMSNYLPVQVQKFDFIMHTM